MKKEVIAIWAQDRNGLIGDKQTMPWHLPRDLQHFKETTLNQTILMGRVTFEGMKKRVLKDRQTLILTRDSSYQVDNQEVSVFHDVKSVLDWYAQQEKPLFIVGGAAIYRAFEGVLDRLIVTEIDATFSGDTYFPREFDRSLFESTEEKIYPSDPTNPYPFTVKTFERKREKP